MLLALAVEAKLQPFSLEALTGAAFVLIKSERFAPTPDALCEAIRKQHSKQRHHARLIGEAAKKIGGARS